MGISIPHYQNGCWLNSTFQYYNEEQCNNLGGEYRTSGTCYIWGITNSIEGIANLYFNQHIDRYLSGQDMVSCYIHHIDPGYPQDACKYARDFGFVDNECFPFQAAYPPYCNEKCTTPNDLIKITGYTQVYPCSQPADIIKLHLIQGGPLPVNQWNGWGHFQTLVGYNIVKEGDVIDYFKGGTVPPGSPYIGMTYWMTKNSILGSGWPDHTGYIYYLNLPDCLYPIYTPIISQVYDDDDIQCNDYDGDGYYNWGIGQKPATCPTCPDEEDCDDTDPVLGPFDPTSYACTLLCNNFTYSGTPLEINQDEVWIEDMYKNRDVIVKSGKTLTIRSKIGFISEAKLIVEPKAKLVIDGGTLTGTCNSIWQGIEVWGDYYESQYTINGECAQGTLIINNSVIENANNIALWHPGDYYSSGGIIKATGSTFKNNRRSAEFISYHNFNPSNPNHPQTNNLSYFTGCSFITDDSFLPNGLFYAHISMWDVEGVKINGCSFSNSSSITNSSARGYGIYTMNASYNINHLCNNPGIMPPCPEINIIHSTFEGLNSGIKAFNDGTYSRSIYVYDAVFTNNSFGINLKLVNNAIVIKSDFDIGPNTDCPNYIGIGINLENCSNYCIEENEFFHTPGGPPGANYIGTRVSFHTDNYGLVPTTEIYKNSYSGLTVGNQAEELNINYYSGLSGLSYLCNDNENNTFDFFVKDDGIAFYQGNPSIPAGNCFSGNGNNPASDFNNQAPFTLNYYFHDITSCSYPEYRYRVKPIEINSDNSCPSHFNGTENPSFILTPEQIAEIRSDFDDNDEKYDSIDNVYWRLVDGGDSQILIDEIKNASERDVYELRLTLLSLSPFLSEAVLKELINRYDIFPDSIMYDIAYLNPEEMRNEELLDYMKEMRPLTSDSIFDILRDRSLDTTAKTTYQWQLSYYNIKRSNDAYNVIRSIVTDTIFDMPELRGWLDKLHNLNADFQIIDSYLEEGNTYAALSLADTIPYIYNMNDSERLEYEDYLNLKHLQSDLIDEGMKIFDVDSSQLAILENIALNSKGIAATQAQNILEFGFGYSFIECAAIAESPKRCVQFNSHELSNTDNNIQINAFPNPATRIISFSYSLPDFPGKAYIEISDINGHVIKVIELNSHTGTIGWDVKEVANGIYFYCVKIGDHSKSGKISVVH